MHIALLTDTKVPVRHYGGTERVVTWLAHGLAERGHTVTLLARPGSTSAYGPVVHLKLPKGRERNFDPRPYLPAGVDLLHSHFPLHPVEDLPIRWTLHGNAKDGEELPPGGIALSANHAARHGQTEWVHNGLDPDEYRFSAKKEPRDLFLGRLHTVKGWDWAVQGARQAGRSITIAGGWRPSIRPGLKFVGEVGGEEKMDLLAESACLWVPAKWDEPFGLTTIEAMVSGTPVLGTRRGALPEVITPETGAMGDTLEELVALRPTLDKLDPEQIRQHVLDHFTYRTMAERYEAVYSGSIGLG